MSESSGPPGRILVIAPNWVGDVVMATPAFRSLRASFPDADITLLIRPHLAKLLDGAPWFDRVVPYDRRKADLRGTVRAVRALRTGDHDLALVMPNSFSSALLARLAGARRRVGYVRDRRGMLLTAPLPRPGEGPGEGGRFRPVYMGDYYLRLATEAGAAPAGLQLELFVPDDTRKKARDLLDRLGAAPGDPLVGLNPGASFGASKCWLPERFAASGDLIAEEHGCRCVILAGPGEEEIQARIAGLMRSKPLAPAPQDLPLDVLKGVMERLRLLVTNDTGPRHVAHALGVPAVVLMGPTDPAYTACAGERAAVLRVEVDCGPCHLKTCPTDHRCMTALDAEQVVEAARALLAPD